MKIADGLELRNILNNIFPNIVINAVAKKSGQRIVYFVNFNKPNCEEQFLYFSHETVLKVLEAPSTSSISRFQREIKLLTEISNPAYPKHYFNNLYKIDPTNEMALNPPLFITIEEKLNGEPLRNKLVRNFNLKIAVEIILNVVSALQLLWQGNREYVHRDLSPDNILIDDGNSVRIIDLGIVRESGEIGLTLDFLDFGPCNPRYCSPEQTINDKANITYKSDFFVIGILLYEMISGVHPFADIEIRTTDELFNAIRTKPFPEHELIQNTTLKYILTKLSAKKPYDRFRRPEDLINELKKLGELE